MVTKSCNLYERAVLVGGPLFACQDFADCQRLSTICLHLQCGTSFNFISSHFNSCLYYAKILVPRGILFHAIYAS
nr:MAG TPA: hypothetical protein [Bacteriophage sp.]